MTTVSVAQPDITLRLDSDGVVREASLSNAIAEAGIATWLGRPWTETVSDAGADRARRMLDEALENGVSAFRQITQKFPSGRELPIEYTAVRLGGHAGLIAVGKNLQAVTDLEARLVAAQQAMERDYWKLREVETRYRMLFDASNEAVILLRASNLRVVEANFAAIRALGLTPQRPEGIVGRELVSELSAGDRDSFVSMLQRVREHGKAPGILVRIGAASTPWIVRASLMMAEPGPMFFVQLTATGAPQSTTPDESSASIEDLIERTPDGFAMLDRAGKVLRANRAFLDLTQMPTEAAVLGQPLGRWLSRPAADTAVLLDTVRQHGAARLFATAMQGELGTATPVEISAARNDGEPLVVGAIIRDVSRRLSPMPAAAAPAIESLLKQVGGSPLRNLVKDAVGVIERHYIEAALALTEGNRTQAAEILGLSRQSLYVKLAQYGQETHRSAAGKVE